MIAPLLVLLVGCAPTEEEPPFDVDALALPPPDELPERIEPPTPP